MTSGIIFKYILEDKIAQSGLVSCLKRRQVFIIKNLCGDPCFHSFDTLPEAGVTGSDLPFQSFLFFFTPPQSPYVTACIRATSASPLFAPYPQDIAAVWFCEYLEP